MSRPNTVSECNLDDLPSWRFAQANVQLMQQNAELSAQMALLHENAALVQGHFRLVDQLRHFSCYGRNCVLDPRQSKATTRPDIPSDTASTSAASLDGYSNEAGEIEADGQTADDGRTTVMMRNIPREYTRAILLELLDRHGFLGSYDLLYLPADFQTELNYGYVFINFTTTENVARFREHFTGFSDWAVSSDRACEVSWSDAAQGLDDNVRRFRNSPIMHESVEDRFKPALFEHGQQIPFPEPTKKIKPYRRKRGLLPRSD
jgi:hypothetical protein